MEQNAEKFAQIGRQMKILTWSLILVWILVSVRPVHSQNRAVIVLPNPKLLGCKSSDCSRLWPGILEPHAIFPKQVMTDATLGCIYGVTALYHNSVPLNDIKSAIDEHYQKWSVRKLSSALFMWRVEPEKFAIQLTTADNQDEKRNVAKEGTREVIYLAFGGKTACSESSK